MNYFIAILLFILTIGIDLYTDYKIWKKDEPIKKPVNHLRGSLLRLIGLVPAIILLGWVSLFLIGFLYWFLFDGLFNRIRKFDWWFTGSDGIKDAKSDNFIRKLKVWQHQTIKITGIVLSLVVYIAWKFY
jgi:hypothetical protein